MFLRLKGIVALLGLTIFLLQGHHAAAALYTRNSNRLISLNPTTAVTTVIGSSNQNERVEDLTFTPAQNGILFGVENQSVAQGGGSKLVRVSRGSGFQTDGPLFDESILGFSRPFSTGVAISRTNPSVAVVTGFDSDYGFSPSAGQQFIWTVDVTTGQVIGPAIRTQPVGVLTYDLKGTKLYSIGSSGRLVTVDPMTGIVTLIGDPGLSDYITGLAFNPADGRLFAIDAFTNDDLVILDHVTGAFVEKIGDLPLGGPSGLAFSVPEPSTLALFAIGCAAIGCRRRR